MSNTQETANKVRIQALQDANPFTPMHQIIYRLMHEDIITCRLSPGMRVTEEQCAALYSSSRTTIRRAINSLMEEGWLKKDGYRTTVSQICKEDHMSLMDYRMAIEPAAARLAARNRINEDLIHLKHYAEACDTSDIYTLYKNDLEFHRTIFFACKNSYLVMAYKQIDSRMARGKIYSIPDYIDSGYDCYQEHYKIFEAIRTRNGKLAQTLVMQHIKMMLGASFE